jgi:hypothetical protein
MSGALRERLFVASRLHANDADLSRLLIDAYIATEAARQVVIILESTLEALEKRAGDDVIANSAVQLARISLATPIVDVLR